MWGSKKIAGCHRFCLSSATQRDKRTRTEPVYPTTFIRRQSLSPPGDGCGPKNEEASQEERTAPPPPPPPPTWSARRNQPAPAESYNNTISPTGLAAGRILSRFGCFARNDSTEQSMNLLVAKICKIYMSSAFSEKSHVCHAKLWVVFERLDGVGVGIFV